VADKSARAGDENVSTHDRFGKREGKQPKN